MSSACVLCSNGCGLDIAVIGDEMVGVRGRESDRVSHGRLGPKSLYGWQGQQRDRLTRPLVRDGRGFYISGRLMAEEYYTLAAIGKAGIGTPHMDGNTRLCTATATAALEEGFGTDGQPGSYTDVEYTDAIVLWGHNVAETQTVLWARMLDRLDGPEPPASEPAISVLMAGRARARCSTSDRADRAEQRLPQPASAGVTSSRDQPPISGRNPHLGLSLFTPSSTVRTRTVVARSRRFDLACRRKPCPKIAAPADQKDTNHAQN